MRLGLSTGNSGRKVTVDLEMIKEVESLGYDCLLYTSDAADE